MLSTGKNTKAIWLYAIHHALIHQGVDPKYLFAKHNFCLSTLKHTQEKIPKQLVNTLWLEAVNITNNDAFCLTVIDYLNVPYLNGLATAVQASENIRQALNVLAKYYTVISPELELSIEQDQDVHINIQNKASIEPWLPEDVDIAFAFIQRYGMTLPTFKLKPSRFSLARPKPKQFQHYEDFFQCDIEFGAARSTATFPIEMLSHKIPSANPSLLSQLEYFLTEKNNKQLALGLKRNFSLRVKAYLQKELGPDFPTMQTTAEHFHISISAFKKRLKSEEYNFQQLCDEVRKVEACRLINENTLPLKEIAFNLGFANSGTFNKRLWRQ